MKENCIINFYNERDSAHYISFKTNKRSSEYLSPESQKILPGILAKLCDLRYYIILSNFQLFNTIIIENEKINS
jgi:hypothetical protein